jgi:sec-independent protein translocase protein TatA
MLAEMLATVTSTPQVSPAIFENIGWQGALVILLVILLLFGGRKLPELARGLGKALRLFKDELNGVKKSVEEPPKTEEGEPPKDQPAKKDEPPKDNPST